MSAAWTCRQVVAGRFLVDDDHRSRQDTFFLNSLLTLGDGPRRARTSFNGEVRRPGPDAIPVPQVPAGRRIQHPVGAALEEGPAAAGMADGATGPSSPSCATTCSASTTR